jgi:hypothetical protein
VKTDRRKFLKGAALGTGLLFSSVASYGSIEALNESIKNSKIKGKKRKQVFNMCGYAAPPVPTVRIGYVGIGGRGSGAVRRMTNIEGVEIKALCDINEEAVKRNQTTLRNAGWPEAREYFGDDQVFKKMCDSSDIDLIYIATSWDFHTPIAVYAMEHGKHVAIEVPAAITMEECWQLVETSERTRKHCMQLENCCYGFFEMLTLNMARLGVFGELVHAEGAYIHTLAEGLLKNKRWRLHENLRDGNLYPTHGLGPVCQCLDINRGDQMEVLISMSTNDFQMGKRAKELAEQDPYYRQFQGKSFRGNMNTSVVRTRNGKTILVQHDVTSPRVYDRKHLLSGTMGMAQGYPLPGKIALGHQWANDEEMKSLEEKYSPELIRHIGEAAKKVGGHGGMDFTMDWRLVDCLRNGLPLDQDVYDAALWSSITPLSSWSIANGYKPIEVPDFTGGSWKTNKPVELKLKGATTGVMNRRPQ